ncbi:MAG: LytTR family DNA-binding domain-containing protein [Lachnospiraceae bacterium]|nr:LytTR family DNA-binding domain-containing protein [Lachnospiraceae bacterium]
MNYKIVICDDNEDILKQLTEFISEDFSERAEIVSYGSLDELKIAFEGGHVRQPDILIMDISWEDRETGQVDAKGIEITGWLQKKYPLLKCVFSTGFIRMAPEIFRAKPTALVLKPLNKEKVTEAVEKCISEIEEENAETVVLQIGGELVTLRLCDVLYLESVNHELHIITIQNEYKLWMKMDDGLKLMPEGHFVRIHQSYAVNMAHINSFRPTNVLLGDGSCLPISKKRYKDAKQQYLKMLGTKD